MGKVDPQVQSLTSNDILSKNSANEMDYQDIAITDSEVDLPEKKSLPKGTPTNKVPPARFRFDSDNFALESPFSKTIKPQKLQPMTPTAMGLCFDLSKPVGAQQPIGPGPAGGAAAQVETPTKPISKRSKSTHNFPLGNTTTATTTAIKGPPSPPTTAVQDHSATSLTMFPMAFIAGSAQPGAIRRSKKRHVTSSASQMHRQQLSQQNIDGDD